MAAACGVVGLAPDMDHPPEDSLQPDSSPGTRPWLLWAAFWVAFGVALRLALLGLAGESELHHDEANYIYLALGWSHFGVLQDAERYLWPPLWPWTLRQALEGFGRHGLWVSKLCLVFTSASVGASVVGLAARLGDKRSGLVAGALWALYLPLAAYTHMGWAEPLFLVFFAPALYLLVAAEQDAGRSADRKLLAAGLCVGVALLTKSSALFLLPILIAGLALSRGRGAWREGLRRAALLGLAIAVPLVPWTLRNAEVYGRFVPSGISLGANAFNGLNAHDLNFDVLPLTRRPGKAPTLLGLSRPAFASRHPDEAWPTAAEIPNTADRNAEEWRRGLAWVREHPFDFLRTRVKKLADFVAPTSYFVRHLGLRRYPGPLGKPFLRRVGTLWAMAAAALLMFLALPGVRVAWRTGRRGTWVLLACAVYFPATSLLVASSRFRVPWLPVLLVFCALALGTRGAEGRLAGLGPGAGRRLVLAGWALLLGLWWVDLPELRLCLEAAW